MSTYLTFTYSQALFEIVTEHDLRNYLKDCIHGNCYKEYSDEQLDKKTLNGLINLLFNNCDEDIVEAENFELMGPLSKDDLKGYTFDYDDDKLCFTVSNEELKQYYNIYSNGVQSNTNKIPSFIKKLQKIISSDKFEHIFDDSVFELGTISDNELYMDSL